MKVVSAVTVEGVLLRSAGAQIASGRDGERYILRPETITIPDTDVPVTLGPAHGPQIGTARIRFEDGQLLFTAQLSPEFAIPAEGWPAISVIGNMISGGEVENPVANGVILDEHGNKDPGIPPYQVLPGPPLEADSTHTRTTGYGALRGPTAPLKES